jgi:hypothetical protein
MMMYSNMPSVTNALTTWRTEVANHEPTFCSNSAPLWYSSSGCYWDMQQWASCYLWPPRQHLGQTRGVFCTPGNQNRGMSGPLTAFGTSGSRRNQIHWQDSGNAGSKRILARYVSPLHFFLGGGGEEEVLVWPKLVTRYTGNFTVAKMIAVR